MVEYEKLHNLSLRNRLEVEDLLKAADRGERWIGPYEVSGFSNASDFFDGTDHAVHTARVDGKLVGVAFSRIGDPPKPIVYFGYVAEAHRYLGVGRQLFRNSLDWLRKRGVKQAFVPVYRPAIIAKLTSLGFRKIKTPDTPEVSFYIPLQNKRSWEKILSI